MFQEAALAPSNTCFRGKFQLDLLDGVRSAMWISHKRIYDPSASIIQCHGYFMATELFRFVDRKCGYYNHHPVDYWWLLAVSATLDVSEPRDRVWNAGTETVAGWHSLTSLT